MLVFVRVQTEKYCTFNVIVAAEQMFHWVKLVILFPFSVLLQVILAHKPRSHCQKTKLVIKNELQQNELKPIQSDIANF